jgi:D-aminoacyl-tRNA deacylase
MILLVASTTDAASLNIKQQILAHYPFEDAAETFQKNVTFNAKVAGREVTFITLNEEPVHAQALPDSFPSAELIVFVSRHSSQSGTPTLSVHTPGNFGNAELGGLPRTLSVCPGAAMQTALRMLKQQKEALRLNHEVSYECTHHGPSLNVPTMFVELGSSPIQWSDQVAAQAVAHAVMAAVAGWGSPKGSAVLGIGGPHYNEKFTRMALDSEAFFGHMVPKYAVAELDSAVLVQCVAKTLEPVSMALLDWKGIKSEYKPNVLSLLDAVGLPYRKV